MIQITGMLTDVESEDSGQALNAQLIDTVEAGTDGYLFVRLHSWNEATPGSHPTLDALIGKRIRVTIEVLD